MKNFTTEICRKLFFLTASATLILITENANAALTSCTQIALKVSTAVSDNGYAYKVSGSFNTPADNIKNPSQSILRLFENGVEIGPAHSPHADIRKYGKGRFSHWSASDGSGESIRFSASNNSDPRRNGKAYTYCNSNTPPPDTQAPTAPTGLIAKVSSPTQVSLTWIASTDNVAVRGYKVFRNGTQIATATSTSYSDSGLTASTSYSYAVSAYDAAGNYSSSVASATVTTSASCTQKSLSVSSASSDTGYAYIVIGTFGTPADNSTYPTQSTLRFFENGIEMGPAHSSHADIRNYGLGKFSHWSATTGSGESIRFSASNNSDPRSNGKTYTYCTSNSSTADSQAPTVPKGLAAKAISISQIDLTWTASSDNIAVKGYKVFRNGIQIGTATVPSYSDSGLVASTSYTYLVSAYDAAGNNSASSTSVSATTFVPPTASCSSTPLIVSAATSDGGYAYLIAKMFGTIPDNSNNGTQSTLRLFENGIELGPAHSSHANIRNLGLGRFSHWSSTDGSGEALRFSTSDNSDPRTNGKSYAYCIGTSVMTDDWAVQGFAAAAGVTGGAGGMNIVVTNLNESGAGSLKAAIATSGARVITFTPGLTGTIKWTNVAYVDYDNMTIDGRGAKITISGYSLSVFKSKETAVRNVIIRNLTFDNTEPGRNAIFIEYGSRDVWVDHCTFRNNNTTGSVGQGIAVWDRGLGLGGLTGITISWNKFEAVNMKAVLISAADDYTKISAQVSLHHNWFDNISSRSPRLGPVTVHMWNNYISNWTEYGTAISGAGDLLLQNNIYENYSSTNAVDADYGNIPANSVKATGNLLLGSPLPVIETRGTFPDFVINYSPNLETANSLLKQRLMVGAGAH